MMSPTTGPNLKLEPRRVARAPAAPEAWGQAARIIVALGWDPRINEELPGSHEQTRGAAVGVDEFRRIALSLPEASESAHMGHPDFRVGGKIFATLGYPSAGWGVVKLTPDQQELFVQVEPEVFVPVKGAWGRRGATSVRLRAATKGIVRKALIAAWCNTAPKALARRFESASSSSSESGT